MPLVDRDVCTGCENCLPYCSVNAMGMKEGMASIDLDVCTECYVCLRDEVCPVGAIKPRDLTTFADRFKHLLSEPTSTCEETGDPAGRGTEEAKTNDVTGRFRRGEVGFAIDMGRPGVGCWMRDVDRVSRAVVAAGLILETAATTPLGIVTEDYSTGALRKDILDTHMLSIIIEGKCKEDKFEDVIKALQKVAEEIDTVFSLGIVLRVDEDGHHPILDKLKDLGIPEPVVAKVNVGLGRPLVED